MSVKARRTDSGSWEVDLHVVLPNGKRHRDRRRILVSSKSAALRWGRARELKLLVEGFPKPKKEVLTLEAFAPMFLDGHARANRQKPSSIAAKEMILRVHLIPRFGSRRLDAITNESVQRLKHTLRGKAPKTVNNVLTVLNGLLKTAVEWDVIEQMPCTIRLLRVPKTSASFHDFDVFERLVDTARETDWQTHLVVLLGGEAGFAVRRDAGAGVGRCGPHHTTALRAAIRLGRAHHRTKGWATTLCAPHDSIGEGAASVSAPEQPAGALPAGRQSTHQEDGAELDATSDATRRDHKQRRARAQAHVLLASGDAGRSRTGDTGAGGTSGSVHNPAVYASESGGDGGRDPTARSARTRR